MSRYQYPFQSRYATIDGVTLHYLDEGSGPVIWLMHGMPMWSYVWRKIIPPLVAAGYRCFVPDLMGFGLSDKPESEAEHGLQRHVYLMIKLIEQLGLNNIIVAGQDWGGPITLRYAIRHKKIYVHSSFLIPLLNVFHNTSVNEKQKILSPGRCQAFTVFYSSRVHFPVL